MFHLICPLPREILVCISGGVDSISAAHFLRKKHSLQLYHFHHGTSQADEMMDAVSRFAHDFKLDLIIHKTEKKLYKEAEFRAERIKFLVDGNFNAIVAHHLGDAAESYWLQAMQGKAWKIPMKISNALGGSTIYRPFLTTPKSKFINYIEKNGLEKYVVEDKTNYDEKSNMRGWLRTKMFPLLKEKQIGVERVVLKKYLKYLEEHKI